MRRVIPSCLLLLAMSVGSCSSSDGPDLQSTVTGTPSGSVSMNKDDYPVFPDADAGADPAIPAEQGGKGFTGEGWETNTTFDLIGDPRAVKGGRVRTYSLGFPGTLRGYGIEANTTTNHQIKTSVYESLLTLHPNTLEYIPVLATHWQIAPDQETFRFRINPNARFSDGTPVTAEDVVATWKLLTDKTLEDPTYYAEYTKLEQPVAESKYIVRMKAKELGWLNFLIASSMYIFPANVLKNLDGAAYLRDYNFKLMPGSGPYTLNDSDVVKGNSVTLRRRTDYWAEKYRINIGQNNFDEQVTVTVRDQNLALEMFKKGDLDYFYVNRSKVWVEDLNYDDFQRGLIIKKKVFNNFPSSTQFLVFNTRRKPWDDIRVRQAFMLLFDRDKLIDKLFFNEYLPINSFYPGTIYENPNNPKNLYNPEEAVKVLTQAGWQTRDAQGRLTKNGQPLTAELLYSDQGSEVWLTVYQDDLRKAGITLNLRLATPETRFKLQSLHQFELAAGAWAQDRIFPNPRTEYHSSLANIENTANFSGFTDKRLDELIEEYDVTFDATKRAELMREVDGILTNQYHYIMEWYPDASSRIAYWNRFGMPQGTFPRFGRYDGTLFQGIPQLWWVDPEKSQKLDSARGDSSIKLEVPAIEDRYWQDLSKAEQQQGAN